MSRINTNVNSLISQRILGQNNNALTKTLEKLSTGFRINRGGDDPAGLIVSEKLRSEKTKISSAISNAERADQIVNIAEGGLQEISSLLTELQGLVGNTASEAGLSTEEKEANQQQVDQILQTIDRISSTTSFQGVKLLNGGYDFQVKTGSLDATNVANYRVTTAKFAEGKEQAVIASVTASAQHGALFISGGVATHLNGTGTITLEIAGAKGTREFSFASNATLASVEASINAFTSVTGVSATASNAGVHLKSTEYGEDNFVSVGVTAAGGSTSVIKGMNATDEDAKTGAGTALTAATVPILDKGQDVAGLINGVAARGHGKVMSINTDALAIELDLSVAGATANNNAISALTLNGGGASFNLGPSVDANNRVQLGLQNVAARKLGTLSTKLDTLRSGGAQDLLTGDIAKAQEVVDGAIDQVTGMRGRLGAFQNLTIGSTIRSLGVAFENVSAAESIIRDTDFAAATAELTRNQILVQAGNSALQLANSTPQNVLALL